MRPTIGDYVWLPGCVDAPGPLRVLAVETVAHALVRLGGYCIAPDGRQHQGNWLVPSDQIHPADDPSWPDRLPAPRSVLRLPDGRRFPAIIIRRIDAGRVLLRGCYLDRQDRRVDELTIEPGEVGALSVVGEL